MTKPGPVSESLAALLFAAALVKVSGYTWQAYKGTYSQFPAPGGGGMGQPISTDFAPGKVPDTPLNQAAQAASQLPVVHQIAKANKATEGFLTKIPIIGPINKAVFDWVNGL